MRRGAWVALPAAVLVLAACSDPQPANDTLPTAESTSAAPTLEPLGPADFPVPDEAREQTEAGAQAMAVYLVDLINHLNQQLGSGTVDTGAFRDLTNACEVCDQVADGFDAEIANGNRYDGATLTPESPPTATVTGREADVIWVLVQSAAQSIGPDGQVVREIPETVLRGGVVMQWDPIRQAWIADQMNLVQS